MRLPRANRLLAFAAAAAGFAAAELILALPGLLLAGRAEALALFGVRPWLLVLAAALVSPWPWRRRFAFYSLWLLLAGLNLALLLGDWGASDPWPEMVRGLAAAFLLLVPADLLIQAARRWGPRFRAWLAAAALALLLLVPAARLPYERVAIGPDDRGPSARKVPLLLMTSLPMLWGEYGAFDPRSRPSRTLLALREEYDVEPIDLLDDAGLGKGTLLLLAQPRWLAPAELVALDRWIRAGGRVVILADPDLVWPSDLPLGDARRPVPSSLLAPLLDHWGVELHPPSRPGRARMTMSPAGLEIEVDSAGSFGAKGSECETKGRTARCAIGAGRAILFADADLLRDDLWVAPGPDGDARHRRLADNPLHVANLLDEAAGVERMRARGRVTWAHAPVSLVGPALTATVRILGLLVALLLPAWASGFRPILIHRNQKGNKSGTED